MTIADKAGHFSVELKAAGDGSGSFEAVLSAPTLDRDGEIIDAYAFEPLPDHIMIDVDHAMSVEKTVASGRPFYDDDGILRFEGTFASTSLAQDVRTLVNEGHIRTLSVAFMNGLYEEDRDDGRMHVRKGELLNAGIVGIPSNRQAVITASKAAELGTIAQSIAEAPQVSTETPDESPDAKASGDGLAVDVVPTPKLVAARARLGILEAGL